MQKRIEYKCTIVSFPFENGLDLTEPILQQFFECCTMTILSKILIAVFYASMGVLFVDSPLERGFKFMSLRHTDSLSCIITHAGNMLVMKINEQ